MRTSVKVPSVGEVHIWFTHHRLFRTDSLHRFLSEKEWFEAQSAPDPLRRLDFMKRRVFVRNVLALYAEQEPSEIQFDRTCIHCGQQHGKPRVVGRSFEFSISHTRSWSALGITTGHRLGIDIEATRNATMLDIGLKTQVLAPDEIARLNRTAPSIRALLTLRHWTIKEAFAKATGRGLALDPRRIVVAWHSSRQAYLQSIPGDPRDAACWEVVSLRLGSMVVGSALVSGEVRSVTYCPPTLLLNGLAVVGAETMA